jgi:hypothetical protein
MAGINSAAPAYGKYAARGATIGESAGGALAEGAVEVATEALPMGFLVKNFGRVGAGQFIAGMLGREIPSEQAATFIQDAIDTAVANPDKTWAQFRDERGDAAYQTLIATLTQGAVMGGASKIMQVASGRAEQAQMAEEQASRIEAFNQFAAASKVMQRDPQTFETFIAKAAEGAPVGAVFIDAQALLQSGVADEVAAASPSVAAQIAEAAQTGGTIAIPVEEYAARIAPTEAAGALLDHLRTSPDGFSRAEAQAYMQEQAPELEREVQRIITEKAQDESFKASAGVIKDVMRQQLDQVGRFTPEARDSYATVVGNFYAVQAAKLGVTPDALYERYPLTVTAEEIGGNALDQGEVSVQFKPGTQFMEAKSEAGIVGGTVRDGALRITHAEVSEQLRGKGEGVKLYTSIIDKALSDGLKVFSDATVEASAVRVYKALARRGYKVVRLAGGTLEDGAAYGSGAVEPAYQVVSGPSLNQGPAGDVEAGGAEPRYTSRNWREWHELPRFQSDDDSTVLFNHGHGGYIQRVEDRKSGVFDGIFALRDPGMTERGPDVTAFRIPNDKILSQRDLEYSLDYDTVSKALADLLPRKIDIGSERFDSIWSAVVEDSSGFEQLGLEDDGSVREDSFMDTFGYDAEDAGVASWFAQKLRGRLAQKLGYQAVEMDDENGTSWYIVPGVESIPLNEEADPSTPDAYNQGPRGAEIEVDGVMRPALNSKGQPIHPTEEGLRNFWRWFGDSRAVDSEGRPLVVYHGTGADFDRFDLALVGRTFGAAGELGFFFSSNPETASKYAINAGHGGGGNVMPVYVRIADPLSRSNNFLRGPIGFLDWNRSSLKQQAESNRNDGILIRQKEDGEIHEFVAFRPEQIKSAIGNTGAFDPANPDILKQGPRGAFTPDRWNIALLKGADLSTFLHETGHAFLEMQFDMAGKLQAIDELTEGERGLLSDADALLSWFGLRDLAEWQSLDFEERRHHHEKFARGFEAYLFEGKAPSIELQGLFQRFRRGWSISIATSRR